jgi:hypothetical protein
MIIYEILLYQKRCAVFEKDERFDVIRNIITFGRMKKVCKTELIKAGKIKESKFDRFG